MADLVPVGYRFLPTDEELLLHYLGNKVAGRPLPSHAVSDADVYGTEPWVLLGSDREAYFFATRKRKNATGSRVDRSAGGGSWILYGKVEVVTSTVARREVVLGRKSSLSFNDGRRKNSGWTMHEYELASASGEFQTQVLCRVSSAGKAPNHQQLRRLPLKRKRGASTSPASKKKACLERTIMEAGHQDGSIFSSPTTSSTLSTEPTYHVPEEASLETEHLVLLEPDDFMLFDAQDVPEEASLGTEHLLDLLEPDDFMLFDGQHLLSEEILSWLH